MFDAPFEDWYVWLGVSVVSVAVLGVVLAFPTAAPPKAAAVADAVDRVSASPPGSTTTTPVRAEAIRIDRRRISLRGAGGTAHATVAFGPVTPASADARLADVLGGELPTDAFDSPTAFADTVASARNRTAEWRPAPQTLRIRRVSWEEVDVVLVG